MPREALLVIIGRSGEVAPAWRYDARMDGSQAPVRRRRWPLVVVIVLIAAIVVLAGVGCFGGLWLFIQQTVRTSGIYEQALARVAASKQVTERIGAPLEPRWVVMGHVRTSNDSGDADLRIPVAGPAGTGQVHVVGTRTAGRWTIDSLAVEFEDGSIVTLAPGGSTVDPTGEPNEHTPAPGMSPWHVPGPGRSREQTAHPLSEAQS